METQNPRFTEPRRWHPEDLAQRLSLAALHQWKEGLRGVIALPAAVALSTAATAMFVASAVDRAFEMIDHTLVDVGRRLNDDRDTSTRASEVRPS